MFIASLSLAMVAGVVTFSLTSAPTTQKQKIGRPQTIFTDDIPLPFDTTKKADGGSTLKGTVVQIGTNALKIPIYKVTFEDANAQSLSQDSIYMVFVPPGVNNMPFDAMIRAANGNQTKEYFGYVYSPNAQLEKDRRNEPVFSTRFPGEFFVSEKGMANSRLASDIRNFETLNNIQFKTSGPRHSTANGILLENRIYAFIVNEPTATILSIRPPAICGDDWKDESEQCDDGNLTNGDGCSSSCLAESSSNATCGNAVVDADEQCDDGVNNGKNDSDCHTDCKLKVAPPDNGSGNPEMEVLHVTKLVPRDGEVLFGFVASNTRATQTITIKNTGTAPLKIGPTIIVNQPFATGTFAKTTLLPGEITTLDISIQSNAETSFASAISFPTNVLNASPFKFTAKATVRIENPGIEVRLNNAPIIKGQVVDLGISDIVQPKDVSFEIVNTGLRDLSIAGMNIPGGLIFAQTPTFPLVIAPQQKETVTLRIMGTGNTAFIGTIGIVTNVQFTPIFSFDVKAKMLLPQIKITQYGLELEDVTGIADFGTTIVGQPVTKTLGILNIGSSVLTLDFPQTTVGDFEIDATQTALTLQPGTSTSFKVRFNATQENAISAMSFTTNVASKNPFLFTAKGSTRQLVSKLEIYDGQRLLAHNDTIDLGNNEADYAGRRTVTIKNAGETVIRLASPVSDVPPVAVMGNIRLLQNVQTIELQPGQSTTFIIEQKQSQNALTGKITIVSTDPHNAEFVIHTSGRIVYSLQGHVFASTVANNILYLVGEFSSVNSTPRTNLAAIDLTTGKLTTWAQNIATDGPVYAIAVHNSITYIGGTFTTVGGQPRLLAAAIGTDGVLKTNKMPLRNAISGTSGVYALAVDATNDRLYIGGRFGRNDFGTQTGVFQDLSLMGMRMSLWTRDTNFTPQIDGGIDRSRANIIRSIALDSSVVYVGGTFYANELNRGTSYDLAAIDSSGHILPWRPEMSDDGAEFKSLAIHGNTLYAGGNFKVTDVPIQNLAAVEKYNPAGNTTNQNGEMVWKRNWTPNPDNTVDHLITDGTNLYVAGPFIRISGFETGKFTGYRLSTMQRFPVGNPFAPSEIDSIANYDTTRLILFGNSSIALLEKQ